MAQYVNVADNGKERGDVYSAVRQCVSNMVEDDANNAQSAGHKLGQMLCGKITRKIVKQTVMTSVYGVTDYGAKGQILRWLEDAVNGGTLELRDEDGAVMDVHSVLGQRLLMSMAQYVAKYTMYGIGLTNTPGYLSMLWLRNCASSIARSGHRVSWMTPILELPCTQHYSERAHVIKTRRQAVTVNTHCSADKADINVTKQSNSFPPNFVHSLDSTHCLLTARECHLRHGLTFASIHDSFWTHSADVDTMSTVLREQFIRIHSVSMLQRVHQSFTAMFPDIDFAAPPNHSSFDLTQVRDSEFFFS